MTGQRLNLCSPEQVSHALFGPKATGGVGLRPPANAGKRRLNGAGKEEFIATANSVLQVSVGGDWGWRKGKERGGWTAV